MELLIGPPKRAIPSPLGDLRRFLSGERLDTSGDFLLNSVDNFLVGSGDLLMESKVCARYSMDALRVRSGERLEEVVEVREGSRRERRRGSGERLLCSSCSGCERSAFASLLMIPLLLRRRPELPMVEWESVLLQSASESVDQLSSMSSESSDGDSALLLCFGNTEALGVGVDGTGTVPDAAEEDVFNFVLTGAVVVVAVAVEEEEEVFAMRELTRFSVVPPALLPVDPPETTPALVPSPTEDVFDTVDEVLRS